MYTRKSRGPRTEPWGTPNSMLHFSDIHKEHVTKYFYDNLKKYNNSIHWLMNDRNYNDLALDNANDLKKVNALIENYGVGPKTKVSSIQKALKDFNLKEKPV